MTPPGMTPVVFQRIGKHELIGEMGNIPRVGEYLTAFDDDFASQWVIVKKVWAKYFSS